MKILTFRKSLFFLLFISVYSTKSTAQAENTSLMQDPKFERLLHEKRKVNSSLTVNNNYKIQIYNGETTTAKNTLSDFKKYYRNYDATIVFSTPTYKVWVGNFKNRIEAERHLLELKKEYKNALLIKPSK
jgi:hypothetical protein